MARSHLGRHKLFPLKYPYGIGAQTHQYQGDGEVPVEEGAQGLHVVARGDPLLPQGTGRQHKVSMGLAPEKDRPGGGMGYCLFEIGQGPFRVPGYALGPGQARAGRNVGGDRRARGGFQIIQQAKRAPPAELASVR